MRNELIIKKCRKCGATVQVIEDCICDNCAIKCCGEKMEVLVPNEKDEKNLINAEITEDEIYIKIDHPMSKEHYISNVYMVKENVIDMIKLYPEQDAICRFKYLKNATIYCLCNEHGLYKMDVK